VVPLGADQRHPPRASLAGRFRPAHAFLLGQILAKIDFLEETLATLSAQVEVLLAPFESGLARLMTIPGEAPDR
jgi:hypothetical protein